MTESSFESVRTAPLVSIDIETTGLDRCSAIVSIAFAWRSSKEIEKTAFWIDPLTPGSDRLRIIIKDLLAETLFNPDFSGVVVFHNLDFDLRFLMRDFGSPDSSSVDPLCRVYDTLTISRVHKNNKFVSHIDPLKRSCHSLKYLAEELLDKSHTSFDEATSSGNIRLADRSSVLEYNCGDSTIALELYEYFRKSLSKEEWEYIEDVEMPQILNLFCMNWTGVRFDRETAEIFLEQSSLYLKKLEQIIYSLVGRSFNISSSQELSSSLFFNSKFQYNKDGVPTMIKPLFMTGLDQVKVDLDTLNEIENRVSALDGDSQVLKAIPRIMQYLELTKTVTQVENLVYYCERKNDHYRIFPSFRADAKSGRVKVSKPNLLGLSKSCFKRSSTEGVPEALKGFSPRNLLIPDPGFKIASADVKALDLSVVTHGSKRFNPHFEWVNYFSSESSNGVDIHMAVFRRMDPAKYAIAMAPFLGKLQNAKIEEYNVVSIGKSGITLQHRPSSESIELSGPDLQPAVLALNKSRNLFKVVNLSTSYLVGPGTLACNLTKESSTPVGVNEAKDLLDVFYKNYPEIRAFQDHVSNSIYEEGFYKSILGRRYYADGFDELNQFYASKNTVYEFVCKIHQRYWYLKAEGWEKEVQPVIEGMRTVGGSLNFQFRRVLSLEEISRFTFRKNGRRKKSKFNRKSEDNQQDVTDFELSRIQITNAIDQELSYGTSLSDEGQMILNEVYTEGGYRIPEKWLLFYRVNSNTPSSRYFRFYVPLVKSVRKFFPLYCQGVANSVATMALSELRDNLVSSKGIEAKLLLFIHDEIVVEAKTGDTAEVVKMMASAIS